MTFTVWVAQYLAQDYVANENIELHQDVFLPACDKCLRSMDEAQVTVEEVPPVGGLIHHQVMVFNTKDACRMSRRQILFRLETSVLRAKRP
jgi:hypothetical protein